MGFWVPSSGAASAAPLPVVRAGASRVAAKNRQGDYLEVHVKAHVA